MHTYYARVSWTGTTTPDHIDALTTALAEHGPSLSMRRDESGGAASVFVEAESIRDAQTAVWALVDGPITGALGPVAVEDIRVMTEAVMEHELEQPLFPDVVGYAEIAELAGVSRQRARQFREIPGFPAPVIETGQGPLFSRAAIDAWVEKRDPRPGRPRAKA